MTVHHMVSAENESWEQKPQTTESISKVKCLKSNTVQNTLYLCDIYYSP